MKIIVKLMLVMVVLLGSVGSVSGQADPNNHFVLNKDVVLIDEETNLKLTSNLKSIYNSGSNIVAKKESIYFKSKTSLLNDVTPGKILACSSGGANAPSGYIGRVSEVLKPNSMGEIGFELEPVAITEIFDYIKFNYDYQIHQKSKDSNEQTHQKSGQINIIDECASFNRTLNSHWGSTADFEANLTANLCGNLRVGMDWNGTDNFEFDLLATIELYLSLNLEAKFWSFDYKKAFDNLSVDLPEIPIFKIVVLKPKLMPYASFSGEAELSWSPEVNIKIEGGLHYSTSGGFNTSMGITSYSDFDSSIDIDEVLSTEIRVGAGAMIYLIPRGQVGFSFLEVGKDCESCALGIGGAINATLSNNGKCLQLGYSVPYELPLSDDIKILYDNYDQWPGEGNCYDIFDYYCQNGVRDNGEAGEDCGGQCKACICDYEADFIYYPKAGRDVEFYNTSTGGQVYSWNFGDGTPSVVADNPVHTFPIDKEYTVCLHASNYSCDGLDQTKVFCRQISIGLSGTSSSSNTSTNTSISNPFVNSSSSGGSSSASSSSGTSSGGTTTTGGGTTTTGDSTTSGGSTTNLPPPPCLYSFAYNGWTSNFTLTYQEDPSNPHSNVDAYYWTFGDGAASNAKAPSHTYSNNGTYEVCLTTTSCGQVNPPSCVWVTIDVGSCQTNHFVNYPLNISINYDATDYIIADNVISSGRNVNFNAGYQVALKRGFHAQANCNFHAYIDGCDPNSNRLENDPIEILNESIDEELKVKVYPNPFEDRLTIDLTEPLEQSGTVALYDLQGRLMLEQDFDEQSNRLELQTDALNSGMYVVRVQVGYRVFSQKLVK